MNIKFLIFIIFFIFLYLFTTFIFSFVKISNYVGGKNYELLSSFVLESELSNNLYTNSKKFIESNLPNLKKILIINNNNTDLSGEFSDEFILKTFLNSSKSISNELSDPKIMLYFYDNSKELAIYFQKYLMNIGYYSFNEYILESNINKDPDTVHNENDNSQDTTIDDNEESLKIKFDRLVTKFNATQYFFFISPIHFKLSVYHQDIPFTVIFKFNGFKWKISNIVLDYSSILKLT
tara:strand:+ start:206 stop:913 length:708 start_codon:yes stop_codon:yes gene_type:complete